MSTSHRYVYGPVPSRRLGRSLGIDPLPAKTCSYDCIYCQVGRTTTKTLERREYVEVEEILTELRATLATDVEIDYIAIAGSGEPTLHSRLGELIDAIRELTDRPIAVITNGSLLWMPEVQQSLMQADVVIPSLDAGDEQTFHYVNRPVGGMSLELVVNGIAEFTRQFMGEVWLEVFLLAGVTSIEAEMRKIAALVERIAPARTQINTATRPTAEEFAFAVRKERIEELEAMIPGIVEIVSDAPADNDRTGTEAVTGDSILDILERHPCTVRDMAMALRVHPRAVCGELEELDRAGRIRRVSHDGRMYYCAEPTPAS